MRKYPLLFHEPPRTTRVLNSPSRLTCFFDPCAQQPADLAEHLGGIAPGELLAALHGAMGALAGPVGVRIKDKTPFPDRFDQVAQGMVYHPVAERRSRNQAALGIVDEKAVVSAWLPALRAQLLLQGQQLSLLVEFEARYAWLAAFALARLAVSQVQVFKRTDLGIQIRGGLHLIGYGAIFVPAFLIA